MLYSHTKKKYMFVETVFCFFVLVLDDADLASLDDF